MSELLPTGTVTLLLADVEGSTRLWETQPEQMTAALALLNQTVNEAIAAHDGVRPLEQGEGDSFVAAFARASDAVACALTLQRAPLAPIRLRIGVHTGEVQLRDDANYAGPTINRTARLRDLAHGGQTILSGATEPLVADRLPDGVWLSDLGSYPLRDLPRPERVVQLCHPDLRNEFPPLRVRQAVVSHNLPAQLTSFVGRQAEMAELRQILTGNRLVTLTGAGGSGKTRLAVEVTSQLGGEFSDGVWYVDLAPIANPDVVPVATARTLGLLDQLGRSTMDTLVRFFGEKTMLLLLDNCEHLLDTCGTMVVELLKACPHLTSLTTSREPLGVPGELTWRVPSLSLTDEAIELFDDRARRARPDFVVGEDNTALVEEICRRLDGMPLAIELAAARVRALSLTEILDGLRDRFRLLTSGARTAVRRQQTLRASVDWSHALLSEPERVLFRRLAVFMGGFDLDAAQAVCGGGEVERYQVLDQLALLVDKSLVVAEDSRVRTRYRLLETVRQYAQEKLGESGEVDVVRTRHRDHYARIAARLDTPAQTGYKQLVEEAEIEIDNLRAAFTWSRESSDTEVALTLASSLQPVWLALGRVHEGLAWFDAVLTDDSSCHADVVPAVRARALADRVLLHSWAVGVEGTDQAELALAIAREYGDQALLARALTARGILAALHGEPVHQYFAEAADLARAVSDRWRLCQILGWQANLAFLTGDPIAAHAVVHEGRELAEAIGDRFTARQCRTWAGWAQTITGDLAGAATQLGAVKDSAKADHDLIWWIASVHYEAQAVLYQGDPAAALAGLTAAAPAVADLGALYSGNSNGVRALAALAAGDVAGADRASRAAWEQLATVPLHQHMYGFLLAEAALARGDLVEAHRRADEAVSVGSGWYRVLSLIVRARIQMAEHDIEHAERDAYDALTLAANLEANLGVPDILECLAAMASVGGSQSRSARLFGAAESIRRRIGAVRFKVHDADYEASVAAVRKTMGDKDFDEAFAEGCALSTREAIVYAQRGKGERKRPPTGWSSLTPAERDVVRLVCDGLANKEIAKRLLVSPRTVQTHLTHVYAKLDLTSRVQLVQEAGRHT